jgi:hypothetical protein
VRPCTRGTASIIRLDHTNEQQDLKLEERAVVIASLGQQVQVPPAPVALAVEPDNMSDVDAM